MTQYRFHEFALRIHLEGRISIPYATIGECRRGQLHFNKLRRYHIETALKYPHRYPEDAIALYEPLTTEIDRTTCTLHYRNMTNADQRIFDYLDAVPPLSDAVLATLKPFGDFQPNGQAEPEPEPEKPPEKPIWDPT